MAHSSLKFRFHGLCIQNKSACGNTFRAQIETSTLRKMLLLGAIVSWCCVVCMVRAQSYTTIDFCDRSLCPNGHAHVACPTMDDIYSYACRVDAEVVDFSVDEAKLILMRLNELRNKVASGNFKGLMGAAGMPTLVWDDDLAYVSERNVCHCELIRDRCANTPKFGNVGQTLSYIANISGRSKLMNVTMKQIAFWFSEEKLVTMDDILNYRGLDKPIPNFAQILHDRSHTVGCAALDQTEWKGLQIFITCSFNEAPVIGRPIYNTSSQPGEACVSGKNPLFESLCAEPKKPKKPKKNAYLKNNNQQLRILTPKSNENESDKHNNGVKSYKTSAEYDKEYKEREREKDWWRSKFYRFLAKMGRATKKISPWNVVVLTKNHEVDIDKPLRMKRTHDIQLAVQNRGRPLQSRGMSSISSRTGPIVNLRTGNHLSG